MHKSFRSKICLALAPIHNSIEESIFKGGELANILTYLVIIGTQALQCSLDLAR